MECVAWINNHSELCRKERISQGLHFKWSKEFMEAGKKRLSGDTMREANTSEIKVLKDERKTCLRLTSHEWI